MNKAPTYIGPLVQGFCGFCGCVKMVPRHRTDEIRPAPRPTCEHTSN